MTELWFKRTNTVWCYSIYPEYKHEVGGIELAHGLPWVQGWDRVWSFSALLAAFVMLFSVQGGDFPKENWEEWEEGNRFWYHRPTLYRFRWQKDSACAIALGTSHYILKAALNRNRGSRKRWPHCYCWSETRWLCYFWIQEKGMHSLGAEIMRLLRPWEV